SNLNNATHDIEVSWDAPSVHHTGFTIERFAANVDVATAAAFQTVPISNPNQRSFTFSNLSADTQNQFVVFANGGPINSPPAAAVENWTEPTQAWTVLYDGKGEGPMNTDHPDQPTDSGQQGTVSVTWDPSQVEPDPHLLPAWIDGYNHWHLPKQRS